VQVSDAVSEIERLAPYLGYVADDLFEELRDLVSARTSLLMRVAKFASDGQVASYLTDMLGREPNKTELALSSASRRRLKLTESDRIELERRQNDRCALCGRFLEQAASPHVDHKVPLAKGGEDALFNLQLLCSKCNLGKHDLVAWHLGVPYQSEEKSLRLRYVVLARSKGRCSEPECDQTAKTTELELVTRVPLSVGGRWLFDNLRVMCTHHASHINEERRKQTKRAIARERRGKRRVVS
jgi:5-methylcytosine-specific restriction endonuclease McrA